MTTYSAALKAYLAAGSVTQAKLASDVGTTQPTINRYAGGRFPDRDMAERIDRATGGAVSFELWQAEAARRIGLDVAA